MKKFKIIITLLLLSISTLLMISCDKGTDSVGFDYYLDANDNRIVHFIAKGSSNFGSFDYEWNFGDGSAGTGKEITHTFESYNKFIVTLTATIEESNIETTVTKEIELKSPTITDLNFDYFIDANDSRVVHFTANGKSDYGSLEYEWSFGDGTSNTGKTLSHTFGTYGKYIIILTATIKDSDIKTTISKEIVLNSPVITDLDFDYYMNASDSRVVNFIAKNQNNYSDIEYEWDFGDGSVGTGKEINHAFNSYNKYTITLTATIKDSDVVATITKEIDLNKPVIINLDFDYYIDANNRLMVHFIADGKSDYGTLDYEWDFGDGDGDVGTRISHTFGTYGKYTIMLTAKIKDSDIETTILKDIELEKPTITDVDFDYYIDANDRLTVHFIAKGKSDYGNIEYTWNFGDGAIDAGKDITHVFKSFSNFTVILTATIEDSDVETTIQKNIKLEKPTITDLDFEAIPDKKNPRIYNFKATSKSDYGNIEYEWDFGDGTTTSGNNVQYGFEYFGIYEITLKGKIVEYDKIESITKKNVEISAPAITRLDIIAIQDDGNPFLYHFSPIAETTWGTLEYEWSFGDGKIAYDMEEPTNTYGKYASYNVQLKAKIKETGATRTVNQEVTVQSPVFKNYEITYTVDPNDPLQIYFTIENKDGENNEDMSQQDSFIWEFGDGDTSSGLRVNHRYESYGEKTVYVTLRTAQQTQKTLTKTFTLETPHINNIKITGTPSMKAGNIIEYRVSADSEFSDEIEYSWEFEDGTQKAGRAVQREMSFWPVANDSGNITENIYIKASIPRLNVSVKETKEVQVMRPKIENFKIHCVNTPNNNLEWICDTRGLGKNVTSSAGGDIEYEWVFNGQTYTGANQRFKFDTYDASYTITATAKIEDTNITETDTFTTSSSLKGISFSCTSKTLDSNNPDALKLECTAYDDGTHSGTSILWDFGENSDKYFRDESEHTYEKAGTYPVTLKFKSNQLISPIEITQDYTVLVNVSSYFDRGSKSGTADCGGWQTSGKYTVYRNNFDLFNKDDFIITNTFSTGNTSCKCNGAGWNFTDNVWHGWDEKSADCWGNIDQWVNTTICAKADPNKCVKNY